MKLQVREPRASAEGCERVSMSDEVDIRRLRAGVIDAANMAIGIACQGRAAGEVTAHEFAALLTAATMALEVAASCGAKAAK